MRLTLGLVSTTLLGSIIFFKLPTTHADGQLARSNSVDRKEDKTSLLSLIRTYAVYTLCSVPVLVDKSPQILAVLMRVPGISQITEAAVRATFFAQVSFDHG